MVNLALGCRTKHEGFAATQANVREILPFVQCLPVKITEVKTCRIDQRRVTEHQPGLQLSTYSS